MQPEHPFSLSFTAASLRPELTRVIAEAFLQMGTWPAAKKQVLSTNALQARSPLSAKRLEIELRRRLSLLSPGELNIAATGDLDERTAIAWLAAMKASSFLFDFAAHLLRDKLAAHDPLLRSSDYEAFFNDQSVAHPQLLKLTTASHSKIRSILKTMLRDAGLAQVHGRDLRIRRPVLPHAVLTAILQDSPRWLAGFLVPDSEIPSL